MQTSRGEVGGRARCWGFRIELGPGGRSDDETVEMLLVASGLTALLSLAPQDPDPVPPRVVGVDEHGWPVFAEQSAAGAGTRERRPGGEESRPSGHLDERGSDSVGRRRAEAGPDSSPARRGPALSEVFSRLGTVTDFESLDGVAAHCRLTVFDERGAVLGTREWSHEADLRDGVLRDRLALPDRRVHGRDGERVFASLHGLRMDSEESLAREQLALFGTLLRAPWCFAARDRYELVATRDDASDPANGPACRVLEFRAVDRPDPSAATRYVLRCTADTMQPLSLEYQLGHGRSREVRFGDWRQVDAVRLPFRLEWVNRSGTVASVMEIVELSVGHRFPERQFRPLR